jgi:hypothetical protein
MTERSIGIVTMVAVMLLGAMITWNAGRLGALYAMPLRRMGPIMRFLWSGGTDIEVTDAPRYFAMRYRVAGIIFTVVGLVGFIGLTCGPRLGHQ